MALLEVENLKVGFETPQGVLWAVRGVSFAVQPGETLAIVGESGCGKTVLCRNLVRLCAGNARVSGSIRWRGEQLLSLPERRMRKVRGAQIAYLFQDPKSALDPTFSIGAQIVEAILAHEKIRRGEAKKRALQLLCTVRLEEPERQFYQYPHQLSGGMLQRAALAVALACGPALLIADEPTTALDASVQAEVLALLSEVSKKLRMATLLITHDFGVAAQLADRIAVMYAGKLVEMGRTEEVLYAPRHPYTWGLLASLPGARIAYGEKEGCFRSREQGGKAPIWDGEGNGAPPARCSGRAPTNAKRLAYLPGTPPDLLHLPVGDAFAPRNAYALAVDYEKEPPAFWVSETHLAATWLLHEEAPKVVPPVFVRQGRVWIREEYRGLQDADV